MKFVQKKILAREILIFSSSIGTILLLFVGLLLYDAYHYVKVENIRNQINELEVKIDSIAKIRRAELAKHRTEREFDFSDIVDIPPPKEDAVQLKALNDELDSIERHRLSNDDFHKTLLFATIFIFLIVYPMRIFVLIIKWSLKTIRET